MLLDLCGILVVCTTVLRYVPVQGMIFEILSRKACHFAFEILGFVLSMLASAWNLACLIGFRPVVLAFLQQLNPASRILTRSTLFARDVAVQNAATSRVRLPVKRSLPSRLQIH